MLVQGKAPSEVKQCELQLKCLWKILMVAITLRAGAEVVALVVAGYDPVDLVLDHDGVARWCCKVVLVSAC